MKHPTSMTEEIAAVMLKDLQGVHSLHRSLTYCINFVVFDKQFINQLVQDKNILKEEVNRLKEDKQELEEEIESYKDSYEIVCEERMETLNICNDRVKEYEERENRYKLQVKDLKNQLEKQEMRHKMRMEELEKKHQTRQVNEELYSTMWMCRCTELEKQLDQYIACGSRRKRRKR